MMPDSQNRFSLLDQIPLGICVLQSDYSVIFWNRCLEDWTKISRDRILGRSIREFFPHLSQPLYVHRLAPIFAGGPPTIFSSQLHKHLIPATLANGQNRIQHTTVTAVPADDDDSFYAMLSIQDVTDVTSLVQSYRQMRDQAVANAEEIKRSAAALQDSEKRFRTSVENMLDCFAIYRALRNEAGEIVDFQAEYVNDAVCLTTQLTREQHLSQGLCELLPAHQSNGLFAEYCQVVETGKPLVKDSLNYEDQFGHQHLTKAFDIRVAKFDDGYVATWRDITDRKQTEQSLRESEERLQMALEGSGGGFWDWNIVNNENYLSPRWLEMLGYEKGELPETFSTWKQLIHPDEKAEVIDWLNTHLQNDSAPYRFEYRMLTKSGEWKWIANYAKVVTRDERGNPLRMAGIHHDISDRKQIEEALQQREEQFRFITNTIPQIVWTTDAHGVTDYVNQRWIDYTGLPLESALTVGWRDLIHPDDLLPVQEFWTKGCETASDYRIEYRLRRYDGMYRWHLVQGLPMCQKGRVVKWFGTCTDIHDDKELEIKRRTLLEREQAAREAAERANRIKDEFLAILSHELRSPLNPILGWTKLMQNRKFDPAKTTEALATIERNAKLQTQLIDDLLDVAKILRGKLSMESTPIDLVFVIESAIDTVRSAAVAKSILLHPVLPQVGLVSGDAARLQQIVWNLLSNAIKFTPNNGRVDIRLERVTGHGTSFMGEKPTQNSRTHSSLPMTSYAQITVTDTGKGINPTFLPHIFESFRQEDASTTRKFGGLGLGLAIVYSLVEAHGGTIWADSPGEGMGSTFTIRLPLLNLEPGKTEPSRSSTQELNLSGVRVLAVDDDPDARDLLTTLLTQYGAEVLTVVSAGDVLANLETFQPHVLVSDVGMPEVDGYSLIDKIRTLPPVQGGKIPAIALTAYAREDDREQAITRGFQCHITKPLDPEQLVQAVIALVQR
ncbi:MULTISPECIES: PAS domain S-box protein [unclassified Leptolyngbya]|uniref:PAS domain S-box protein n=1 Tax=unclassified Leptolyngbya TaxID=2650499 RepID=UPI0016830F09|nr:MULTISPECIES: PAS domain S-box protein [unclassified Leptolyngbya]MBD1913816.1 PAS domain S-box protein [Leptolyngbya sp. FACHB-8]MBD2156545.1 PAS domain S-box protein [Leptolyngbya sp. FACHB-16]